MLGTLEHFERARFEYRIYIKIEEINGAIQRMSRERANVQKEISMEF